MGKDHLDVLIEDVSCIRAFKVKGRLNRDNRDEQDKGKRLGAGFDVKDPVFMFDPAYPVQPC